MAFLIMAETKHNWSDIMKGASHACSSKISCISATSACSSATCWRSFSSRLSTISARLAEKACDACNSCSQTVEQRKLAFIILVYIIVHQPQADMMSSICRIATSLLSASVGCSKRLPSAMVYMLEGRQRAGKWRACMSLAVRRCRRLASCWRTASGLGALQVTPALLVAPLL